MLRIWIERMRSSKWCRDRLDTSFKMWAYIASLRPRSLLRVCNSIICYIVGKVRTRLQLPVLKGWTQVLPKTHTRGTIRFLPQLGNRLSLSFSYPKFLIISAPNRTRTDIPTAKKDLSKLTTNLQLFTSYDTHHGCVLPFELSGRKRGTGNVNLWNAIFK